MSSFYDSFKESGLHELPYSPTQYAADVQIIKKVIRTNTSLLILGLSGVGKSSLLRYLVANPAIQEKDIIFTYIDCNVLDWSRPLAEVETEICDHILACLHYHFSENWKPEFGVFEPKRALRAKVRLLSLDQPVHLAIVFDRSEVLHQHLDVSFFNYLRGLRDTNFRISYIFSGRTLAREAFGELADVLRNAPHWIGKLRLADAQEIMRRHLYRLGTTLTPEQERHLLHCVGHYAALIKCACELAHDHEVDLNQDQVVTIEQLLQAHSVATQCRDLWQDIGFEAQQALHQFALEREAADQPRLDWLVESGLLYRQSQDQLMFTSLTFKEYILRLDGVPV